MDEKLTVVGYVRVSSEEQAKKGLSIEYQIDKIKEYCKLKEYKLSNIYADKGRSGGTIKDRPEFKQMLNDAEKGLFNALIVLKIDRFSRSGRDLILSLDDLNKHNIQFVSIMESIDTTTAIGKAVLQIIGIIASLERDLAKERTEAIQLNKVKKGQIISRVPFGYDIKKEYDDEGNLLSNKIFVNKKEVDIVKKIFELALKKSKKDISNITSLPEYKIGRILKNSFYIGKIKYKKKQYDGKHTAIIEESLFNRVNNSERNIQD